jgi:hypothetical protein
MPLNVITGLVRGLGRQVPNSGMKQLTGKYGNKNYYKGKGAKSMGRHTSKGKSQTHVHSTVLIDRNFCTNSRCDLSVA